MMKIKMNTTSCKRWIVIIVIAITTISILFILSHYENNYFSIGNNKNSTLENTQIIAYNGNRYKPRQNLDTILFFGVDKLQSEINENSYNNTQQSDFLMLIIIDHQCETYKALHINRDVITEIPVLGVRGEKAGFISGQLALAHTYGSGGLDSCHNTVEATSRLLNNIEIKYFVSTTMDSVPLLNDLVGGVELEILQDFSMYDPNMQKGTTMILNGTQALAYVRNRKDLEDSSNLSRMLRQQQYINKFAEKISALVDEKDRAFFDSMSQISPYIESNLTVTQIDILFDKIKEYTNLGIDSIKGKTIQGDEYMEFYVDKNSLNEYIIHNFYEINAKKVLE